MRDTFLPFSVPSINDEDVACVSDVLRSGWITTGTKAAEFEHAFAESVGASGAMALTSATAGMHVLMQAMGIGPGDEVITPSLTWVSTVNLIVLMGAKPVFADIDPHTLMVTADTLEPCITSRTKLMIPVHFAGAPCDRDSIQKLSQRSGVAVVEDAAHAAGTKYKGVPIGSSGTSIFSFHPIKNITTGEGGMVCSDDEALLTAMRQLKFHGLGVDAFDRQTQGRSPQAEVLQPGYKYNLTDLSAALGISQLKRLSLFNQKRKELALRYLELLAPIEEVCPLEMPNYDCDHAWHLFIVRLDTKRSGLSRDEFMARLKERNIGTGLHFRAVHSQKYYRDTFPDVQGTLPHTEDQASRICSLPLFPDMTDRDQDDVVDAIKAVLKGR